LFSGSCYQINLKKSINLLYLFKESQPLTVRKGVVSSLPEGKQQTVTTYWCCSFGKGVNQNAGGFQPFRLCANYHSC
jgi:hypothetical protein